MADVDPNGYTIEHQPQIGSCGNVWAKATVTRTYRLKHASGSRDVWKIFYGGRFTSQAGASPGACNRGSGTIIAGVHGKIGNFATIRVFHPGGRTFNPLAVCTAPCTAEQFVAAFFAPGATWINDGPGVSAYFHFRPDSPWLPLLCAPCSTMNITWDQPGWVPGSAITGDIATTC